MDGRWASGRKGLAGLHTFLKIITMQDGRRGILYIMASPTWGGGEEYIYRIVEALRGRKNYDCYTVAMSRPNTAKMSAVSDGDHLFGFRAGSLFDIVSAVRIARIADRHRIDIIHVNKFSHAFIAVWARAFSRTKPRIVMTRHLIRKGKTGWLYSWLYGKLDRMIFVSELGRNEFFSRGAKIAPDKTEVMHNGIPDALQDRSLRTGNPVTIAYAGRIAREKGLHVLFSALAELPRRDFRLKVIGGGDEEYIRELEGFAASNGLTEKIVFTGFSDNVNRELQEAEIGVLPSIVREGFPLAAVEYMRAELAIVASAEGGQAERLADKVNSLLTPNGDRDRLAEALALLLSDPAKRREMGKAARKTFEENLTLDIFMNKLTRIYDEVCG